MKASEEVSGLKSAYPGLSYCLYWLNGLFFNEVSVIHMTVLPMYTKRTFVLRMQWRSVRGIPIKGLGAYWPLKLHPYAHTPIEVFRIDYREVQESVYIMTLSTAQLYRLTYRSVYEVRKGLVPQTDCLTWWLPFISTRRAANPSKSEQEEGGGIRLEIWVHTVWPWCAMNSLVGR